MLHYVDENAKPLACAIGERVKNERRAKSWTLDQLAAHAGVSRRMVVNVEHGAVNPSVGTLLRLGDALGVGLPALVEPPARAVVNVTRRGDGAVLWTGDYGGLGVLVAGTDPPDIVELWDWTLAPGDRHESEAHAAGTRELLQVLEGAMTVEVDGRAHALDAGDGLTFFGDADHAYTNLSDAPTRFTLAVYEPGVGLARRTETPDA